ncbi:MAG: hypothetical protein II563_06090 [Treponema sp.]|nr:hypothetical protein [Treponema sp.]MBQ4236514.1 hypothetical protein [Treponema sp.]
MKAKDIKSNGHTWHFVNNSGLMQLNIRTIDDVLELENLDPKLWVALSCPVSGLEFSEDTLQVLDLDKDGRVRIPEIISACRFIKKYFKKPEIIMEKGCTIPVDALSDENFDCGHSPAESAATILEILGKSGSESISLEDVSMNEKLFSPSVYNGDKILPAAAVKDENAAKTISEIIDATGGADDISGDKGITRKQFEDFFNDLRALREWRELAQKDAPGIFFMGLATDSAASSYMAVKDKIDEFFLRCNVSSYSAELSKNLHDKELSSLDEGLSGEKLSMLPLAEINGGKVLPLVSSVNPAWAEKISAFRINAVENIFESGKTCITEEEWKKISADFAPYMAWFGAKPSNTASSLSMDRVNEILASDAEQIIRHGLDEEEKHPPLALATLDLKKMILLRRDFLRLLKNFVSFEEFYNPDTPAVFQCGTLYIDSISCDLCFKVTDETKHAGMVPLSQCYMLYCDCTKKSTGEKMRIAAMVSAGKCDNLIAGRNGLFFDRNGGDWDATITKIIENPISIRQAFWSPYKKLVKLVQEKISGMASKAESKVNEKMAEVVNNPEEAAKQAAANSKKIDIGTIAAISVAFTGIATVVGSLLNAFFGLGKFIPLGIAGIILLISLPSMIIAWSKLRQRNIAPILDASGWAINGNVKINIKLGSTMTATPVRPKNSKLTKKDPFADKKFPWKRIIFLIIIIAAVIGIIAAVGSNPDGISGVWKNIKDFFTKFTVQAAETAVSAPIN